MKRKRLAALALAMTLCIGSLSGVAKAEDNPEVSSVPTETPKPSNPSIGDVLPDIDEPITSEKIADIIDKYLHKDVSVTPVQRKQYSPVDAQVATGGAVTVSAAKAVCELAEDGFEPYEISWVIGDYFEENSQYASLSISNLEEGATYYVIAKIHYKNPQTLKSDWLNIFAKVEMPGEPPVKVSTGPAVTVTLAPTPTGTPTSVTSSAITKPVIIEKHYIGDTVSAKWLTDDTAGSYQYRILDKSGKVIKTGYSMGAYFYAYNVKAKSVLAIQVRGRKWDAATNGYTLSKWSKKVHVVKQPIAKTKKIKKNSIKVKWAKIKGASSYRVYVRKHGVYRWKKVKTTKKRVCTIKKYKGKRLNTKKTKYDVKIVAVAKVNGKKVVSDSSRYIKAHK